MAAMGAVRAVDTCGSIPTLEAENAALRAALAVAQEDTRMISEVASEVEGKWRDAELRGEFRMMVGMRGRWLALGSAARVGEGVGKQRGWDILKTRCCCSDKVVPSGRTADLFLCHVYAAQEARKEVDRLCAELVLKRQQVLDLQQELRDALGMRGKAGVPVVHVHIQKRSTGSAPNSCSSASRCWTCSRSFAMLSVCAERRAYP